MSTIRTPATGVLTPAQARITTCCSICAAPATHQFPVSWWRAWLTRPPNARDIPASVELCTICAIGTRPPDQGQHP